MSVRKRRFLPPALLLALLVVALMVVPILSGAATTNTTTCEKIKGTWVCTTFTGPGNNQGGVGTTTDDTTQGNTSNYSPTPQGTGTVSSCSPNGNSANCK